MLFRSPSFIVEQSATVAVEGGKKNRIKLEYFEGNGQAVCQLLWSSEKIARDFVPKSQLYSNYVPEFVKVDTLNFSVRPNPVSEVLELVVASPNAINVDFELYNMAGQLVLKNKFAVLPGISTVDVKLKDFASGQYLLKLRGDGEDKVLKVFKL